MFKLSQTVAQSWVITLPNPEEIGWETQLAEFDTSATQEGSAGFNALEAGAAATLAGLVSAFPHRGYAVTSHLPEHRERMQKLVSAALAQTAGATASNPLLVVEA